MASSSGGAGSRDQWSVEIFDGDGRLSQQILGFSEETAEDFAVRRREAIRRRGWNMTVRVIAPKGAVK